MPLEEEDEPPEGEDKPKVLSASLLNVILGASMKIVKKLLIDSILFFFKFYFMQTLTITEKETKEGSSDDEEVQERPPRSGIQQNSAT